MLTSLQSGKQNKHVLCRGSGIRMGSGSQKILYIAEGRQFLTASYPAKFYQLKVMVKVFLAMEKFEMKIMKITSCRSFRKLLLNVF